MQNFMKSYKCDRCGSKKYYVSGPFLSEKRNIIADNCPYCFFGSMIIDFDDDMNFLDDYIDRYYDFFERYLGGSYYASL